MTDHQTEKTQPIISTKDLCIFYGTFRAVKNVDMRIIPNKITAIIGPSGCGKSTVLRSFNRMNDFIPSCHVTGEITFHGHNIYAENVDPVQVRQKIGMVFQKPNPFPKSIFDNVAWGLKINGMKGDLSEPVEQALRQAALWDEVKDHLKKSGLSLSGGQQQRLCIARMLALKPAVLLLDEPTASLDFKSAARIEKLLLNLKRRYGILAVSHSLAQTRRIADRVCVLREGRIVQELDHEHLRDPDAFQTIIDVAF